jgi:hypothetical protein
MTTTQHVRNLLLAALVTAEVAVLAWKLPLNRPYGVYAFLGAFVIHMRMRPGRWEVVTTLATALALGMSRVELRGSLDLFASGLVTPGIFLGLASLLVLGAAVPWCSEPERKARIATFEAGRRGACLRVARHVSIDLEGAVPFSLKVQAACALSIQ